MTGDLSHESEENADSCVTLWHAPQKENEEQRDGELVTR